MEHASSLRDVQRNASITKRCFPKLYKWKNNLRVLFCITMFNETFEDFMYTLNGVLINIAEMVRDSVNTKFSENSFSIILIADGLEKIDINFRRELECYFEMSTSSMMDDDKLVGTSEQVPTHAQTENILHLFKSPLQLYTVMRRFLESKCPIKAEGLMQLKCVL